MIVQLTPAPYSNTDTDENRAIDILKYKLNGQYIKSDIKSRDKMPNVDGYLEIVDDKQIPIGKIEIQIKKIPQNSTHYDCEKKLFAYSSTTTLPVILICVDIINEVIFWKQIQQELIIGKEHQNSFRIHFSQDDTIDKRLIYLGRWKAIIEDYKQRLGEYQALKERLEEIANLTVPLDGMSEDDISAIQTFIDELNHLLDYEYPVIKRLVFRNLWKIGVAIHFYTEQQLAYSLYSLKNGKSEPLVKYIATPFDHIFHNKASYGFLHHLSRENNPLKTNPKLLAKQFLYERIRDVLHKKQLLTNNEYLCREYLFNIIDKYYHCLGLEKKESYSLEELSHAFNVYLPIWYMTGLKLLYDSQPDYPTFITPRQVEDNLRIIHSREYRRLDSEVKMKIHDNIPVSSSITDTLFLMFKEAHETLSYLEDEGLNVIYRLYKEKDFNLIKGNGCSWIWEFYHEKDLKHNLFTLLTNFEKVYSDTLKLNQFRDPKYNFFEEFEKIIFVYGITQEGHFKGCPYFNAFFLKTLQTDNAPKVEIYDEKDIHITYCNDLIVFNGKEYLFKKECEYSADFVCEETPMLNFIYTILKRKIDSILQRIQREQFSQD